MRGLLVPRLLVAGSLACSLAVMAATAAGGRAYRWELFCFAGSAAAWSLTWWQAIRMIRSLQARLAALLRSVCREAGR